jgi:hypothetical protein
MQGSDARLQHNAVVTFLLHPMSVQKLGVVADVRGPDLFVDQQMWSASPANVPLTYHHFGTIPTFQVRRGISLVFKYAGGYQIVNIVNKNLLDGGGLEIIGSESLCKTRGL